MLTAIWARRYPLLRLMLLWFASLMVGSVVLSPDATAMLFSPTVAMIYHGIVLTTALALMGMSIMHVREKWNNDFIPVHEMSLRFNSKRELEVCAEKLTNICEQRRIPYRWYMKRDELYVLHIGFLSQDDAALVRLSI